MGSRPSELGRIRLSAGRSTVEDDADGRIDGVFFLVAADGMSAATASGPGPSRSQVRPRWNQMVRRPTPWPPRMSAVAESPTIQPSSSHPHRRAASVKMPGSGFHEPTTADTQTASTSSPSSVTSSLRSWYFGPLVTTAIFQPEDRSLRSAAREGSGNENSAG